MKITRDYSVILHKYISVSLLLFFFVIIRPFAAPAKIRFDRFGLQDGLSDNTITSICQDSKGFMWFGTSNGLNRFDGYNYIYFKHDQNDSTTISDNIIQVIFEDNSGVLWVGTLNGGLNRYNRETGTFVRYVHDPDNPEGISSKNVYSIAEGKDGTLWVGTFFGLNSLDRGTGKFRHYFNDPSDSLTIINNIINCVFSDKKGNIWIGTNYGLNVISHETGIIKRLPDRNKVTSELNQNIIDIAERDNGILWLSTWGGGLRKFDTKTETYEVFLHDPDDPNSINSNIVGHLSFDNYGILWFGTLEGLHSIDPSNNMIVHYNQDSTDPFSISSDSIWAVYNDTSGILWIGTLYGGGNKIVPSKSIFRFYHIDEVYKGASKGGYINKFCEDKSSIWLASNYGLHSFDTEKETFTSYLFSESNTEGNEIALIRTIFNDNSGQLWLGTSIAGLVCFDIDKGSFTSFTSKILYPSAAALDVNVINKDSEGVFWLGTDLGFLKFNPRTKTFEKTEIDNRENQNLKSAYDIVFDSDGNRVWISGQFGLSQFDRKNKELNYIFSNIPGGKSLRSNYIICLMDDGHGSLWLGTYDGLYSYDKKTGNHKRYTLFNDIIHCIIKDKKGNTWASTKAGLSRIEFSSKEIHNYDTGDGLPFTVNMNNAMYCGDDGKIFVGGQNGFYTFHPDSILTSSFPPPVVITSFKVDNVEAKLEKKITEITELAIPYGKAPLSLEFAALDYINPLKNIFAYKMEGLNSDWIQSGNERKVIYTNLDPGSYVFKVKAANSQGVWNNEGVSVRITIIPPFWKTSWFRVIVIISSFGLVFLGYLLRVRKVMRLNKELESRIEERTEKLRNINKELLNEIDERKKAESKIKVLSGFLPICASCKKIRDDEGYWTQIESYIRDHSEAEFSHGICPDCSKKLYPEFESEEDNQ